MSNTTELQREIYAKVVDNILLNKYDSSNLQDLISKIYSLEKIEENNTDIAIQYIKARVDQYIFEKIKNLTNLFDILQVLYCVADNYKRNLNRMRYNQSRQIKNLFD